MKWEVAFSCVAVVLFHVSTIVTCDAVGSKGMWPAGNPYLACLKDSDEEAKMMRWNQATSNCFSPPKCAKYAKGLGANEEAQKQLCSSSLTCFFHALGLNEEEKVKFFLLFVSQLSMALKR
ncbi:uncharacterized protein LOC144146318 [Haemaphysalis longicornis]